MSKDIDTTQVDDIERSFCSCSKCEAPCRSMPGFLSVGDIERIGNFTAQDPEDPEFLTEYFQASEGAKAITRTGEVVQIETIVPRQTDDGTCVFFDEEDGCLIHEVAPFGCRNFSVCSDDFKEDDRRSKRGHFALMQNRFYQSCIEVLKRRGAIAAPLIERKLHLISLLEAIKQ